MGRTTGSLCGSRGGVLPKRNNKKEGDSKGETQRRTDRGRMTYCPNQIYSRIVFHRWVGLSREEGSVRGSVMG